MFKIETHIVPKNAEDIALTMIQSQGKYTQIGHGSYGTVYGSKRSDIVYKLGEVDGNEGYLAYINVLAKQKTHNPFTPKIYGVRFIKERNCAGVFVVAMERLTYMSNDIEDEIPNFFEDQLMYGNPSIGTGIDMVLGIKHIIPDPLQQAIKILKKAHASSNGKISWDLHSGNFMMRGKQIVCIDPLS